MIPGYCTSRHFCESEQEKKKEKNTEERKDD